MGTNYYFHPANSSQKLHIGKSSAGWCFALHVEQDRGSGFGLGIFSLQDWTAKFQTPGHIEDEYGHTLSTLEMMTIITLRSWTGRRMYHDERVRNHATLGPNGLHRAEIDGRHCIGHGEGTWDLITGEFF